MYRTPAQWSSGTTYIQADPAIWKDALEAVHRALCPERFASRSGSPAEMAQDIVDAFEGMKDIVDMLQAELKGRDRE